MNLQTLMNKALKMSMKTRKDYPTKKILKETEKLSVYQEIIFQIAKESKKILKNRRPVSIYEKIIQKTTSRNLRNPRIVKMKNNKEITNESFVNKAIEVLNTIPPDIMDIVETKPFKKSLKTWIQAEFPIKPE